MTEQASIKIKKGASPTISMLFCIILTLIMLPLGDELQSAMLKGMSLAALKIIPTVFPFMVLSDFWLSSAEIKDNSHASKAFEKLFKMNACALTALLSGALCGFPLGVKSAVGLYRQGAIKKDELSRLSPIVNLPSPAFVISGVGVGLLGDMKMGVLLYLSVLVSSLIIGFISSLKKEKSYNSVLISRQSFDLTASVRDAGISSLAIASYIIFFSAVTGLVSAIIKNGAIVAIISTLLEVGNATSAIANCGAFSRSIVLVLIAFALGFSGLSVHLQAFSFLQKEISRRNYLLTKLLIGLLSAAIIFPFAFFAK